MYKEKSNFFNVLVLMALVQAIIMLSFPFANSYLMGQVVSGAESSSISSGHERDAFSSKTLGALSSFFSIDEIGTVSAQQGSQVGCCVDPGIGICETTSANNCNSGFRQGVSCDRIDACTKGVCYNANTGTCTPSRKVSCEDPAEFLTGNPSQCEKKCFIFGTDMRWVTEKHGENIARSKGVPKGDAFFPNVESELACKAKLNRNVNGSCVTGSGACDYPVMKKQCNGEFYAGKYCHELNASTGVDCSVDSEQATTACKPDLGPGVYQIDDCGNAAGVIDECSGFSEVCGYNSTTEKHECMQKKCDWNGEKDKYDLGESWCVYDSAIGSTKYYETGSDKNLVAPEVSRDAPGSTHYKATCTEDGVEVNPCDQTGKRGQICTQRKIEDTPVGVNRTQATCETNRQAQCLRYWGDYSKRVKEKIDDGIKGKKASEVEKKKLKKQCERNLGCNYIQEFNVTNAQNAAGGDSAKTSFGFPACVGEHPKGTGACRLGSTNCTAVFTKNGAGRYVCRQNCGCLTSDFVQKMNNLCVSLGDCGSYFNYKGNFTSNIDMDVDPVSMGSEAKHKPQKERLLTQGRDGDSSITPLSRSADGGDGETYRMYNISAFFDSFLNGTYKYKSYYDHSLGGGVGKGIANRANNGSLPESMEKYVGSRYTPGSYAARAFSIEGFRDSYLVTAITLLQFLGPVAWIATAVSFIYTLFSDTGSKKEVTVSFQCKEWQAPAGVSKETCESCHEESPTGECTEYKCSSLGQNCNLINKNTDNTLCVTNKTDDKTPPILYADEADAKHVIDGPGKDKSEDEKFMDLNSKEDYTDTGPAVEENSELWFSLNISEPSQCKYSFFNPGNDYESMSPNYPNGNNNYLTEHNFSVEIPSVNRINDTQYPNDTSPDLPIDSQIYIRCKDYNGVTNTGNGYVVNMSVAKAPDESPPVIKGFEPETKSKFKFLPEAREIDVQIDEEVTSCRWTQKSQPFSNITTKNEFGPPCSSSRNCREANLSSFETGVNDYLIKCNDTAGNKGSKKYSLKVTDSRNKSEFIKENGLEIGSVSLDEGQVISSSESPASVDVKVKTSKGHDQGKALCKYNFGSPASFIDKNEFISTRSKKHNLPLEQLANSGNRTLNIQCKDLTGISSASKRINFTVEIDKKSPKIISNTTKEAGDLTIRTNEPAQCSYHKGTCDFKLQKGNVFNFGGSNDYVKNQSVEWNPSQTYHIKCRDELGNVNSGCAAKINPQDVNGPAITRIWEESGEMKVKTDREAKCYYSFNSCGIPVRQNPGDKSMSDGISTEHSTDWNPSNTYYIRCKDKWGNPNPSCSAIIQPHSL